MFKFSLHANNHFIQQQKTFLNGTKKLDSPAAQKPQIKTHCVQKKILKVWIGCLGKG